MTTRTPSMPYSLRVSQLSTELFKNSCGDLLVAGWIVLSPSNYKHSENYHPD